MCFVDISFIPELKVDITYQDLLEFLQWCQKWMSTDEAHGGVTGETRDSDITDPESYLHDSLQILSLLYESDSH